LLNKFLLLLLIGVNTTKKYANKKTILLFFIIAHLAYLAMSFTLPLIQKGMSVRLFDLNMFQGYDLQYATTFVNEITPLGRTIYFYAQFPLDLIYPLAVSIFFCLFFYHQTKNKKLALMGFSSMVVDYTENSLVFIMLNSASLTSGIVMAASVSTIIKGVLYLINYGLTIYLFVRLLVRNRRKFKQG